MKISRKLLSEFIFILICFSVITVVSGCKKGVSVKRESSFQLGTMIELSIYDNSSQAVFDKAFALITDLENRLSRNISASEVSDINSHAGISDLKVSDETFYVIEKSIGYSELTNSLFDITIGPIVSLWSIGNENARVPQSYEISEKLPLVNYKNIKINETQKTVYLEKPGMEIDLGAVAKGYIADKIAELFKSNGVQSAIINLGGNVLLVGKKPDGSLFRIGLQDPFDKRGMPVGTIRGEDISIVTSGIYERYFEQEGIKYHHIIDPETGYPVDNEIMGITVINKNSMEGDALSTSLFMLGTEKALNLVESLNGVELIVITKDREIYLTSGIKESFTLTNNSFILIE